MPHTGGVIPIPEIRALSQQQLLDKYGAEMMQYSLDVYQSQDTQHSSIEKPEESSDRFFETTKIEGDEFRWDDIGTAIGNIPASAENLIRGVGELIDAAPEIGDALVDRPWETLKSFGSAVIEPFTSKENFRRFAVEDPVGLATTFAPGTGQLAKVGGLPRLVRGAIKATSPASAATSVAKRGSRLAEGAGQVASDLMSIPLGLPEPAISGAYRAGLEGGRSLTGRGAFRAAQRGVIPEGPAGRAFASSLDDVIGGTNKAGEKFTDIDLITVVEQSVKEARQVSIDAYEGTKIASGLSESGAVTLLGEIERKVAENLARFDIDFSFKQTQTGVTPGYIHVPKKGPQTRVPDQPIFKTAPQFGGGRTRTIEADEFAQLQDYLNKNLFDEIMPKPGESRLQRITAQDLQAARERLDGGFASLSGKNKSIVTTLKQDLNNMTDQLLGPESKFAGARQKFADEQKFFSQIGQQFGTDAPPDKRTLTILRNLTSVFNSSNTAKLELARGMENLTGVPFRALLAGRAMSSIIPKGLVGRQAFLGALAISTALAPAFITYTLPSMAIFSPKIAGNLLNALGVASKPVKASIELLHKLRAYKGVNEVVGEGVNIGVMMGRIMDQETREGEQHFFRPLRGQ